MSDWFVIGGKKKASNESVYFYLFTCEAKAKEYIEKLQKDWVKENKLFSPGLKDELSELFIEKSNLDKALKKKFHTVHVF